MCSIRHLATQYIGRPVVCHSHYGVHYGTLHHVDDRGLYIAQVRRGALAAGSKNLDVQPLGADDGAVDAEHVWLPLLFIPFAAAIALSPWWWGGYYW